MAQHIPAVAVHTLPTPSDSAESSDRESPTESRSVPEVPMVQVPHRETVTDVDTKAERNGTNDTCVASPIPSHGIAINMQDGHLWKKFKAAGTEMIVTKPGR